MLTLVETLASAYHVTAINEYNFKKRLALLNTT